MLPTVVIYLFKMLWLLCMFEDYGLDNPDPETVPRGPRFLVIPEDTIYEEFHYDPIDIWYNPFDDRSQTELVELHCDADAYPPAEYSWFREASGQVIEPVQLVDKSD